MQFSSDSLIMFSKNTKQNSFVIKMLMVSLTDAFELLALAAVDGKAPLATGDDDEVPGKNKHAMEEKEVNFAER